MDDYGLCPTQNNLKALCGMFMRIWVILGFNIPIVCYRHNINGVGCNYMFNNLFIGVWCVTKRGHHSMHLHFICNHCPSWDLGIDGV
jgi:hypothetical protein